MACLIFQGSQSLSPNTTLKFAQASSSVHSARFLDDGAGTINFNRPIELGGSNTSQVLNLFVGNNNTANGGSSSGTTTGSTIQVGDITHTSLAADTGTWTINATGANGYRLQTGTITLNNLTARTAAQTTTYVLNPTSANMTVGGRHHGDGKYHRRRRHPRPSACWHQQRQHRHRRHLECVGLCRPGMP